jgi:hypothetical protein
MAENLTTRRYVEQAVRDNGIVELRHQGETWRSGTFDDPDLLLAAARRMCRTGNLFISLNRPTPRVAANRMGTEPLGNEDFQWVTRLFFDFDPLRQKGTASTQEELDHAVRAARDAQRIFRAMAWPDPLLAISGNGAHLLYRCHAPNTAEVREMLAAVYSGLREDFSSDHIEFDRAVRNPGRICTLYGSVKRKGESAPGRPHRQSRILHWPHEWRQVSMRSLEGVAEFYATRHPKQTTRPLEKPCDAFSGSGDYATLDVVAWFASHDLYEHHIEGLMHAVRCPWEDEHTETHRNDTIVYVNTAAWPGFYCHHSHCAGRGIRDVIALLGDADRYCGRQWEGRHV